MRKFLGSDDVIKYLGTNPKITKSLNFVSKHASAIATILQGGHRLYKDYKNYEGEDLKTAALITAAEIATTVAAGAAIGFLAPASAPVLATAVAGAVVSHYIGKGANWLRDKLLGYLYLFEIYVLGDPKKRLSYLDLKEAV
jgi:hypothetical protein